MSTSFFYVGASAKDYQTGDNANTTGATMDARVLNQLNVQSLAVAEIDLSGLAGEVITEARLFWYTDDYTKSKGTTFHQAVQFSSNGSDYSTIWSDTPATAPAGWQWFYLSASEIAALVKDGTNYFRFVVSDPGGTENRDWAIRTWDYDPSHTWQAYLEVTHQPASIANQTQVIIV